MNVDIFNIISSYGDFNNKTLLIICPIFNLDIRKIRSNQFYNIKRLIPENLSFIISNIKIKCSETLSGINITNQIKKIKLYIPFQPNIFTIFPKLENVEFMNVHPNKLLETIFDDDIKRNISLNEVIVTKNSLNTMVKNFFSHICYIDKYIINGLHNIFFGIFPIGFEKIKIRNLIIDHYYNICEEDIIAKMCKLCYIDNIIIINCHISQFCRNKDRESIIDSFRKINIKNLYIEYIIYSF